MTPTDDVLARALALGFDAAAALPLTGPATGGAYRAWLEAGYHGEMAYMKERAALRLEPRLLAPDARTMIVLLANYARPGLPSHWNDPAFGRIARYAWSRDYHDVLKAQLFELDGHLRERSGREAQGKACVDSVPLLERDFAEQSGLGFTGRNTCLITPGLGSWSFIAALLVPEALEPGLAHAPRRRATRPPFAGCGSCTRCLVACPTGAFAADHVLDARRCISYLTIELRGPIPRELRALMGNWVFGCDVCQEECPYNRAAPPATLPGLQADVENGALPLGDLLALDEAAFKAKFKGTPILRAKRRGLVRNACVAAGNSGDRGLVGPLSALLSDGEPLVRGHAAWALGRLGGGDAVLALRAALAGEADDWVREEINDALGAGARSETGHSGMDEGSGGSVGDRPQRDG
ncbi:MAG: tRNA epoxyqueuosine(34) reductase QueG [Nitrososphaerales archaeon]